MKKIYKDGKSQYLHRVVAKESLPSYSDDRCVVFRNGDRTDCRPENLMCVDRCDLMENDRDSYYPYIYKSGKRYIVKYKGEYKGSFATDVEAWEKCVWKLVAADSKADILDGRYTVNQLGGIYDNVKGRWLAASRTDGKIRLDGKTYSIGLLVYNAFIGGASKISHKNGLKYDNCLVNLEKARSTRDRR